MSLFIQGHKRIESREIGRETTERVFYKGGTPFTGEFSNNRRDAAQYTLRSSARRVLKKLKAARDSGIDVPDDLTIEGKEQGMVERA
jgi:hypothetical protein